MNFLPKWVQRLVVVTLLGVWFSPAASAAVPVQTAPLPVFATAPTSPVTRTTQAPSAPTSTAETASYAEREKQATDLEQFQGGAVYLYFGSGALLVLIILLILLL